jgi:predicted alpha/beta hydrolase family esterase
MRVYLIHGWGGSPLGAGFEWLKKKLEERGVEVVAPYMPDSENPKIEPWVSKLKEIVKFDEEVVLLGHSIGVQAILRYLEGLEEGSVKACVFVAGWFDLKETAYKEPEEEKEIVKPWIETKINFDKVKGRCKEFIALFSDDDPCVDIAQGKTFEQELGAKIFEEKGKGHYDNSEDWDSVLEEVLRLV